MTKPLRTDREARRIVEERRDEAYFRARDAERLDGELKSAQLRALRHAKEGLAKAAAKAAVATKPAAKATR